MDDFDSSMMYGAHHIFVHIPCITIHIELNIHTSEILLGELVETYGSA